MLQKRCKLSISLRQTCRNWKNVLHVLDNREYNRTIRSTVELKRKTLNCPYKEHVWLHKLGEGTVNVEIFDQYIDMD